MVLKTEFLAADGARGEAIFVNYSSVHRDCKPYISLVPFIAATARPEMWSFQTEPPCSSVRARSPEQMSPEFVLFVFQRASSFGCSYKGSPLFATARFVIFRVDPELFSMQLLELNTLIGRNGRKLTQVCLTTWIWRKIVVTLVDLLHAGCYTSYNSKTTRSLIPSSVSDAPPNFHAKSSRGVRPKVANPNPVPPPPSDPPVVVPSIITWSKFLETYTPKSMSPVNQLLRNWSTFTGLTRTS